VFNEKRYGEIAGILLFLAGIILLLSLASYSQTDYRAILHHKSVNNLIGPVGAVIAHLARSAFGVSSYIFVICLFLSSYAHVKEGSIRGFTDRLFALFFLTFSSSILFSSGNIQIYQNSGGFTGSYIFQFLHSVTGTVGAYLIIAIMNIVGLILLGTFSLASFFEKTKSRGDNLINRLGRFVANLRQPAATHSDIPLTTLGEKLSAEPKKKRPPWIERRTVKINTEGSGTKPEIKYLEMLSAPAQPACEKFISLKESISSIPASSEILTSASKVEQDKNIYMDNLSDAEYPEEEFDIPVNREIYSDDLSFSDTDTDEFIHDNELLAETESPSSKKNRIYGIDPDDDSAAESLAGATVDHNIAAAQERIKNPPDREPEPFAEEAVFSQLRINQEYIIPTSFLHNSEPVDTEAWEIEVKKNSLLLVRTLSEFGIESKVINVNRGPVITLYEMQIAAGIKINRVVGLSDDIAMALAAYKVRIVAPIPGKSAIGVELPNKKREMVTLGDVIKSKSYNDQKGHLKVGLGKDILGFPVTIDLKNQPHLLIAGSTGSGKSVCVNSIITSIVYNYDPNYVRFILVDPKMVELQLYNGMPHLLTPVITEPQMTPAILKWTIYEMERRYRLLASMNTRDIINYNGKVKKEKKGERLPFIVIIIDELADLMMAASKEIESYITRIAQKARAVGIHLVLATQRPSVDVITGIIKANFPARIAFQVAQKTDSRTIIDQNGAEKLLGKGDMLYQSPMSSYPVRIQGAFISENEITSVVEHLKIYGEPQFIDIEASLFAEEDSSDIDGEDEDELFVEALKIVEDTRKASASYLQRRLSIGYNRAARMIEKMEELGYVGPQQGSKPRDVFI
jgi:DNA segregation ATPase FtsK/SpoIIIE-like protein